MKKPLLLFTTSFTVAVVEVEIVFVVEIVLGLEIVISRLTHHNT